jgi:hypothetical protein
LLHGQGLAGEDRADHILLMSPRDRFARFIDSPLGETMLFVAGILLDILGLALAPLPGPGGIFLIAPGVALILKTSMWAKRNYVRLKRWQPKAGTWMDWGLRRKSAQRRVARKKAIEEQTQVSND